MQDMWCNHYRPRCHLSLALRDQLGLRSWVRPESKNNTKEFYAILSSLLSALQTAKAMASNKLLGDLATCSETGEEQQQNIGSASPNWDLSQSVTRRTQPLGLRTIVRVSESPRPRFHLDSRHWSGESRWPITPMLSLRLLLSIREPNTPRALTLSTTMFSDNSRQEKIVAL